MHWLAAPETSGRLRSGLDLPVLGTLAASDSHPARRPRLLSRSGIRPQIDDDQRAAEYDILPEERTGSPARNRAHIFLADERWGPRCTRGPHSLFRLSTGRAPAEHRLDRACTRLRWLDSPGGSCPCRAGRC